MKRDATQSPKRYCRKICIYIAMIHHATNFNSMTVSRRLRFDFSQKPFKTAWKPRIIAARKSELLAFAKQHETWKLVG